MAKLPPSSDEPSKPRADKTVPDIAVDKTIEYDSPPAEKPKPRADKTVPDIAVDKTIEYDSPPAEKPKPRADKTVPDIAVDKTIEYDSPPAEKPKPRADKTVPDVAVDKTIEYAGPPSGRTPSNRRPAATSTQPTVNIDSAAAPSAAVGQTAATLDDAVAPQELESHMTAVWGEDISASRPGMTIKGKLSKTVSHGATLVIGQRAMRVAEEAEPDTGGTDYDLLNVLGEGGMGVVYSARQASINRDVAVKMLKSHTATDERQRQKFLSEAVITGDLDHPNIVPIYELGANRDGALFYSMKRVQGTPWDKKIGTLSLNENLAILMRVADAVAFAHARGVIHRDLKPENVMLGDFGEVLVMDWGLAIPTAEFHKSEGIEVAGNMGGTPAYMAPEMARGPFERITYASDIYLLGAILFEIITGTPPHSGADVMKCLSAAARNHIVPTDKQGELLDIAMTAMATSPTDRHASVRDFQDAVRGYMSHVESIALAARAEQELAEARRSEDYQEYARAVFAFEEALGLWPGNAEAQRGVVTARTEYARCALHKGDFDLGLSLLDPQRDEQKDLYVELDRARQERDARQRRLKQTRRVVAALLALVFLVVSVGLVAVNYQRQAAVAARQVAETERERAEAERIKAEAERIKAEAARDAEALARSQAEAARRAAEQAQEQERQAKEKERLAKEEERQAKEAAIAAQEKEREAKLAAELAEQQEREAKLAEARERANAEYQAYVALIGLAAAKIDENAYNAARELLDECQANLRNWEWGRLKFLCEQGSRVRDAGARLESVAVSADGNRFAAGGWEGLVNIWQRGTDDPPRSIPHDPTSFVYDVAFSPDGRLLATGSSDRAGGFLRLWDADTGQLVRRLDGHDDTVLSVRFSRDGQRLLTSSYDNTARLWDVASGRVLQTFAGHDWWVWSARFSPDERRIVTASHDGTVLIWSVETGQPVGPPFMGHRRGDSQAPVYIAEFSPVADPPMVASGGLDSRVLLWNPDEIQPFDYEAVIQGERTTPQPFVELKGHRAAVRSLAFSANGTILLSGCQDNAVNVWDVPAGQLIKSLRGHGGGVLSCRFTDDDRVAVSASHDKTVRFWDIDGYEEARVLRGKILDGHLDAILAASFSRDGRQVITASRDRSAKLWDAVSGQETRMFREGHEFTTSTVTFFQQDTRLLTSALDNSTRIWDVATGSEQVELRLMGTGLHGAASVSPDGRWILTGGNLVKDDQGQSGWIAQLWDGASGEQIRELRGHDSEVTAVAISPDAQWLFTGDRNGRCILWDRATGQERRRFSDDGPIHAAVFLPDGQRLLTANDYRSVRQWQLPDCREIDTLRLEHPGAVVSMSVSRDGRLALTSCTDGLVRLWDVDQATVVRSLPVRGGRAAVAENLRQAMQEVGWDERQLAVASRVDQAVIAELLAADRDGAPEILASLSKALEIAPDRLVRIVVSVTLSPDGETGLTVAAEDRVVRCWDLRDGREITFPQEQNRLGPFLDFGGRRRGIVWAASFSGQGNQVATAGGDSARLWDLRRAALPGERELMVFSPHGSVASADLSPDGRWVVTASWDRSARIWDAQTRQTVRKLGREQDSLADQHQGRVNGAVFSPDGQRILTVSDDGTAKLWTVGTWQLERTLSGHTGPVLHGAFSHDGTQIVTSSEDTTARLWDTATGKERLVLRGHDLAVLQAAFSTDDQRLVTGSDDNTAIVWDLQQNPPAKIHTLGGHTAGITSVAFLPDEMSTRILTGSKDYTAILWDATTGQEIMTLKGHLQEVTAVGFSPDSRFALTGSRDGTAILWLTQGWREPNATNETAPVKPAGTATR
ncbi:MAG: protein kinase [Pirellulaceae bacterium]|nr:protein kinase [Pirellulaceae bacterium]